MNEPKWIQNSSRWSAVYRENDNGTVLALYINDQNGIHRYTDKLFSSVSELKEFLNNLP